MVASAGLGGHAVAMYGGGRVFEARMLTPGGDIIQRHRDESIRVEKFTNIDEEYRTTSYGDEIHRTFEYDDEEIIIIKSEDEKRKATKRSRKKKEAINRECDIHRTIMWEI